MFLIKNNFGQIILTDTNNNRVNNILVQLDMDANCITIND